MVVVVRARPLAQMAVVPTRSQVRSSWSTQNRGWPASGQHLRTRSPVPADGCRSPPSASVLVYPHPLAQQWYGTDGGRWRDHHGSGLESRVKKVDEAHSAPPPTEASWFGPAATIAPVIIARTRRSRPFHRSPQNWSPTPLRDHPQRLAMTVHENWKSPGQRAGGERICDPIRFHSRSPRGSASPRVVQQCRPGPRLMSLGRQVKVGHLAVDGQRRDKVTIDATTIRHLADRPPQSGPARHVRGVAMFVTPA